MTPGDCPICGYDRSGDASERCPECGSRERGEERSLRFLTCCRLSLGLLAFSALGLYALIVSETYSLGVWPDWNHPDAWWTPDRTGRLLVVSFCGLVLAFVFVWLHRPARLQRLDAELRLALSVLSLLGAGALAFVTLAWLDHI